MFKIIQLVLFGALCWAFVDVIVDVTLVIARFFFRLADLIDLIPSPF